LLDATKDDAVVAKVVATTVVAKIDVVKVVELADAEEAVANLHKAVRVSEICLICVQARRHFRQCVSESCKNGAILK
jgi:hypothetical protein